jgi:hypothetical protein
LSFVFDLVIAPVRASSIRFLNSSSPYDEVSGADGVMYEVRSWMGMSCNGAGDEMADDDSMD